ncbi:hypothetical protein [Rhizorhabdus argentea]|uniref:hypothetical protein n=1 Tax=Rhizorhabdus argentea TaxID=1387174 RepID=UPI0030EF2227
MESHDLTTMKGCSSTLSFDGIWAMRFGSFGCLDREMRGGVLQVQPERLFGGDSNFVYHGSGNVSGSEFAGWLDIMRHGNDPTVTCLWGTNERVYKLRLVAELVSPDHVEGRLLRMGHPDKHLTMRKLMPLITVV